MNHRRTVPMKVLVLLGLAGWLLMAGPARAAEKLHLFILSGQSNMVGLNPALSFTPTVTEALAPDQVLVVKDAASGQPIRRWYKQWKPAPGRSVTPGKQPWGDLYDRLMGKVKAALAGRRPQTVTFVWMQGERDARESHGQVYADSFKGLIGQLQKDLGRTDINVVIGRLSDFDNANRKYPHWTLVRQAQVQLAQNDRRIEWVDTDDLNGQRNALHYTHDGYVEMGKRFADKALKLIRQSSTGAQAAAPVGPAASAASGKPWFFVVAADPQLFWGPTAQWEKTIAQINRLKPPFVVVCGDLINRKAEVNKIDLAADEKMARAYLQAAAKLDPAIALHNVAGNHDVCNQPTPQTLQWYEKRFGKLWYSFTYNQCLFIVLDSNSLKFPAAVQATAEKQMAWLRLTLEQAAAKQYQHTFVFMHHPICLKSVDEKDASWNIPLVRRRELLALFHRYGVTAVFAGHCHRNALVKDGPLELITTSSCGKALGKDPLGLRIVKVWPDRIEHTYYGLDALPLPEPAPAGQTPNPRSR